METFTLRWSADRSLYFVEPSRGRNARGFWLGAEKNDFPVPPEIIKGAYSGAFAFDGYYRRWFSMRGFIVQQSDPQTKVPASAELVRDYLMPAHLVTLEEAKEIIETNRIEASAAAREVELADHHEYLLEQHQARLSAAIQNEFGSQLPEASGREVARGRPNRRDRRRGN